MAGAPQNSKTLIFLDVCVTGLRRLPSQKIRPLDTLFFANNSPTQWPIKIKFIPLGSPLKSAQIKP